MKEVSFEVLRPTPVLMNPDVIANVALVHWLAWNPSVKTGDLVTALSVLVALAGFLYSRSRDRKVLVKEYADRVRSAAAETLSRVDRCQSILDSFYERMQTAITEADEIMVRENDAVKARDYLWKACYNVRHDVLAVFSEENIELAYAPLLGYRRNIYKLFKTGVEMAVRVSMDGFKVFRNVSQDAILNMDKTEKPLSGYLGNRVRSVVARLQEQQQEQTAEALHQLRLFLLETISISDEAIFNAPRSSLKTDDVDAGLVTFPIKELVACPSCGQPQMQPESTEAEGLESKWNCIRCKAIFGPSRRAQ
jgi:hypothetical protein